MTLDCSNFESSFFRNSTHPKNPPIALFFIRKFSQPKSKFDSITDTVQGKCAFAERLWPHLYWFYLFKNCVNGKILCLVFAHKEKDYFLIKIDFTIIWSNEFFIMIIIQISWGLLTIEGSLIEVLLILIHTDMQTVQVL